MKTLERQLVEYGAHHEQAQDRIDLEEVVGLHVVPSSVRSRKRVLVAVVAAVVVLALAGLIPQLLQGQESPPATAPLTPPTTVPEDGLSMTWQSASGVDPWLMGGRAPIVTNGSAFIAVDKSAHYTTADENGEVTTQFTPLLLKRSVDGVNWTELDLPAGSSPPLLTVAGDLFFLGDDEGCSETCPLWASVDGLEWERTDSNLGSPDLRSHIWRVVDPATLLTSRPVLMNNIDGWYGTVMEFDDHLVQFLTQYEKQSGMPPAFFEAVHSTDGVDWTRLDPMPPFADTLTREYLDAGWQSMWRCEVAYNGSQAMMLVTTDTGTQLWTSSDGIGWEQLPPPPPTGETAERNQCIKAVNQGWILTPGGTVSSENFTKWDTTTAIPTQILYSPDGLEWTPLPVPVEYQDTKGWVETAGDTLFVIDMVTGETLVGTIEQYPQPVP